MAASTRSPRAHEPRGDGREHAAIPHLAPGPGSRRRRGGAEESDRAQSIMISLRTVHDLRRELEAGERAHLAGREVHEGDAPVRGAPARRSRGWRRPRCPPRSAGSRAGSFCTLSEGIDATKLVDDRYRVAGRHEARDRPPGPSRSRSGGASRPTIFGGRSSAIGARLTAEGYGGDPGVLERAVEDHRVRRVGRVEHGLDRRVASGWCAAREATPRCRAPR